MPSCASHVNNFVKFFDLFSYGKFLRYNGAAAYTTFSGGFISIAVIIILLILFFNYGLQTAKKQIIYAKENTKFNDDPSQLIIEMSPAGGFMIGFYVFGLNISSATARPFDFKLIQEEYTPLLQLTNSTEYPLVQCTPAHLDFSEKIKSYYTPFMFDAHLCPQLGQQVEVKGKVTSSLYSQLKITVTRCNNTIDPTCMSDAAFNTLETTMKKFTFAFPIFNTMLNPDQQEYKTFFVEDRNRFSFSSSLGKQLVGQIREDIVKTDQSLLPYETTQTQKVVRVPDKLSAESFVPTAGDPLLTLVLIKSSVEKTYKRKFQKLDKYMSYIGGLVGTIIGLIFLLKKYNQKAYLVSISHKLFKDNDGKDINSRSFNILQVIPYLILSFFSWLGCCKPDWKTSQKFLDCSAQAGKQLDIAYILKKLFFLDSAILTLMDRHQIQALCLRQKPTLKEIKEYRKSYFALQYTKKLPKEGQQTDPQIYPQNVSQQEILQQSPSKLSPQIEHKSQIIEDLSEVQLSQYKGGYQIFSNSLKRVVQESKEGNQISQKIVDSISPSTMKKMKITPPEQKHKKDDIEIEDIVDVKPKDVEKFQ